MRIPWLIMVGDALISFHKFFYEAVNPFLLIFLQTGRTFFLTPCIVTRASWMVAKTSTCLRRPPWRQRRAAANGLGRGLNP